MQIKSIKITERASYNYEVSEWTYEIELQEGEDPTDATNYIRNLAISNATADVKALGNNFPSNSNSVGSVGQQPNTTVNNNRPSYTGQTQYRKAPYHQNQASGPRPASEAQKAYYRRLAQQLGYDPESCPETSQEAAASILAMKQQLGLE